MKNRRSILLAFCLLNLSWMTVQTVYAQKMDNDGAHSDPRKNRPAPGHPMHKSNPGKDQKKIEHLQDRSPAHVLAPSSAGHVAVGGYFQIHQIEAARNYYNRPENRGFCPPGLDKKGTGCLPPGQAKAWRKGVPLPAHVVYYDLPRSVVLALGVPPQGYQYVRVASDILLIAIGTRLVMDAIEDLVQ
jgi:Ni/Co efflux regulator RcnB